MKKCWFMLNEELHEKMTATAKDLNLSFEAFVRSCVFSIYNQILISGIENVIMTPRKEKSFLIQLNNTGGQKQ